MSRAFARSVGSYDVGLDDPARPTDDRGPLVTLNGFPVFDPRGLAAALVEGADERDRRAQETQR